MNNQNTTHIILSIPNIQIKELATPLDCSVDYEVSLTEISKIMIDKQLKVIPVIVDNEII